jgi:hypothetical protein
MFDISGLFTKEALIRNLKQLPVLKTPVMDTIFVNRPQLGLAVVGSDMISEVARELPVVQRGGASISAGPESGTTRFYEPLPIRPYKMVTGADLNNLKALGSQSRQAWAAQKIDYLRRACRKTAEAMCAVSLSGTLTWPVKLEAGGWETWTISFGSPLSVTPGKLWSDNDAKLTTVFVTLQAMEEKLQEKGYGGTVEIWAGKTAYEALFAIAEASTTTAKIRVELTEQGINIGGYLVKRRSETYRNPQTGSSVSIQGTKTVRMISTDAEHTMPYCALDDLDANLQPLPFFTKPIVLKDPSGYKIVGESKPFPIPNMDGVCEATVAA